MSIYRAHYENSPWGTVVIRAPDEDMARELAVKVGDSYGTQGAVEVEVLDADGPAEVLIEDWS